MNPARAIPDSADALATYTVSRSKSLGRNGTAQRLDLLNLLQREFSVGGLHAACPMARGLVSLIFPMRPEVEMIGPDASPSVAVMKNHHSLGDLPVVQHPRNSMRSPLSGAGDVLHTHDSISIAKAARPQPTAPLCLFDPTPEGRDTLGNVVLSRDAAPKPLVVEGAKGIPVVGAGAIGNRARLHRGIIRYANVV